MTIATPANAEDNGPLVLSCSDIALLDELARTIAEWPRQRQTASCAYRGASKRLTCPRSKAAQADAAGSMVTEVP